jgi:hypothetical protein
VNKLAISLKEFLITGAFGQIRLGMTRQQFIDIFGKPENWGSHQDLQKAEIWVYGGFEFYFPKRSDDLYMIFSDHLHHLKTGKVFDVDSWIFDEHLTLTSCENALQHEQIPFIKTHKPEWTQIQFTFESGASVTFHADDVNHSQYVLGSLCMRAEPSASPPMHQVSVLLPLHLYEKIRRESIKQKRSISSLCSELLVEQIEQLPDES